jgi:cytochrome P450
MAMEPKYDLYSSTFKANAHAIYGAMREHDTVVCLPGIGGQGLWWFVTCYEDVERILRDDKCFVRDWRKTLSPEQLATLPPRPLVLELLDNHMLNTDGDDHRRLRGLVSKAFTPGMIEQREPQIQDIADQLLDKVQACGEMDLIDDYAFPLPIIVIADLLGVPAADRDKFRVWSNATVTPQVTQDDQQRFESLMQDFTTYLRHLFEQRRQQPREDLITALLQAEERGDRLSEVELFSLVVLLIVAGHETTVNLIANGVLALLQNPEQFTLLKQDPALIPSAIEEVLRYDSPLEQALIRWAAEDLEVGGQAIKRGEAIVPVLTAANRDRLQFADGNTLDITRQPNRHLSFGRGIHSCLGAPLARLEGKIALQTLLRRIPNIRLNIDPGNLSWRLSPFIRGLTALPVAWSDTNEISM